MKNPPIHLLMPMSGQGTRYRADGYTQPKPLIPVSGTPMIKRLLEVFPSDWPCSFVLAENHRDTEVQACLLDARPSAKISWVAPHTKGPGLALRSALESTPEEAPVLVSYCDYGMVWDPRQFERFVRESDCDACVISYRGFHAHYLSPNPYAYCRMEGEHVVEVREKGCFTKNRENEFASCGAYYFKSGRLLKRALEYQSAQKLEINGELYTSLTVQALLELDPKAHVRVFEIPFFFQWGTPEDLKRFEYWESSFRAYNRGVSTQSEVSQILMPMAGQGSRFAKITSNPKPLIRIADAPMFERALRSLPRAERTVLVALDEWSARARHACSLPTDLRIVSLTSTPPGQALSTEAGIAELDSSKDVIVSSCDHAIALDPQTWKDFRANPRCDAAIFTVKGYPGATDKPNSYAYVVPTEQNENFSNVAQVSVKKPVSDRPANDHVLVGTFWFRTASILAEGIRELKLRNTRVNGELYLDSIFEILLKTNHPVRMIPLDGYIGWGDPDALAEALYWEEVFCCRSLAPRSRFAGVTDA